MDIHICGVCKEKFTDINDFISHKTQGCRKTFPPNSRLAQFPEQAQLDYMNIESTSSSLTSGVTSKLLDNHNPVQLITLNHESNFTTRPQNIRHDTNFTCNPLETNNLMQISNPIQNDNNQLTQAGKSTRLHYQTRNENTPNNPQIELHTSRTSNTPEHIASLSVDTLENQAIPKHAQNPQDILYVENNTTNKTSNQYASNDKSVNTLDDGLHQELPLLSTMYSEQTDVSFAADNQNIQENLPSLETESSDPFVNVINSIRNKQRAESRKNQETINNITASQIVSNNVPSSADDFQVSSHSFTNSKNILKSSNVLPISSICPISLTFPVTSTAVTTSPDMSISSQTFLTTDSVPVSTQQLITLQNIPILTDNIIPVSDITTLQKKIAILPFKSTNKMAAQIASQRKEDVLISPKIGAERTRRFICEVQDCTFSSYTMKDLQRHLRTHTGERPFVCSVCSKAFARNDKLVIHMRSHTGAKPFSCNMCPYKCAEKSSLVKHLRTHTNERPYKCQLCSYASRNSNQLTIHLRSHTGDSPFQCRICSSKFNIKSHPLSSKLTKVKPICCHYLHELCQLCSYASRNSNQLTIHLRSHTGDSPFQCRICSSKFKIKSDLKRHMMIHLGQRPFKCDFCDHRSTLKGNLLNHIKLAHNQDTITKCTEDGCSFETSSKLSMREHIKLHQPNDEMRCKICEYQCMSVTALRNHVKTQHNSRKVFKCDKCDFISKTRGNVTTHIARKHSTRSKLKYQRSKSKVRLIDNEKVTVSESVDSYDVTIKKSRYCDTSFKCMVESCSETFVREESLKSHLRHHINPVSESNTVAAMLMLQNSEPGEIVRFHDKNERYRQEKRVDSEIQNSVHDKSTIYLDVENENSNLDYDIQSEINVDGDDPDVAGLPTLAAVASRYSERIASRLNRAKMFKSQRVNASIENNINIDGDDDGGLTIDDSNSGTPVDYSVSASNTETSQHGFIGSISDSIHGRNMVKSFTIDVNKNPTDTVYSEDSIDNMIDNSNMNKVRVVDPKTISSDSNIQTLYIHVPNQLQSTADFNDSDNNNTTVSNITNNIQNIVNVNINSESDPNALSMVEDINVENQPSVFLQEKSPENTASITLPTIYCPMPQVLYSTMAPEGQSNIPFVLQQPDGTLVLNPIYANQQFVTVQPPDNSQVDGAQINETIQPQGISYTINQTPIELKSNSQNQQFLSNINLSDIQNQQLSTANMQNLQISTDQDTITFDASKINDGASSNQNGDVTFPSFYPVSALTPEQQPHGQQLYTLTSQEGEYPIVYTLSFGDGGQTFLPVTQPGVEEESAQTTQESIPLVTSQPAKPRKGRKQKI